MTLVLMGLMSGLLLAAASLRMLNRWLIATTATDPRIVVGVIVIVTMVGLAASCVPARRALLRDPIRALGTD
jgi:hypothetical protein